MKKDEQRINEIRQQILTMHNEQCTVAQMAEKLGMSKDAVHYHRVKMGLKRYTSKMTPAIRSEIVEMKAAGSSYAEIARHLKLHKTSVTRVLKNSDSSTRSFADMMSSPINQLLTRLWTPESVRNCLV